MGDDLEQLGDEEATKIGTLRRINHATAKSILMDADDWYPKHVCRVDVKGDVYALDSWLETQ